MNAQSLPGNLRQKLSELRNQRLFADRLSSSLIIASIVLNILTLIVLAVKLEPLDYQVPVRYSSLTGFDQLGAWYQPYSIAAFGFGVTIINTVLAIRAFGRSRVASFYLLLGSVVIAMFGLIIANAFSSVT